MQDSLVDGIDQAIAHLMRSVGSALFKERWVCFFAGKTSSTGRNLDRFPVMPEPNKGMYPKIE